MLWLLGHQKQARAVFSKADHTCTTWNERVYGALKPFCLPERGKNTKHGDRGCYRFILHKPQSHLSIKCQDGSLQSRCSYGEELTGTEISHVIMPQRCVLDNHSGLHFHFMHECQLCCIDIKLQPLSLENELKMKTALSYVISRSFSKTQNALETS